jgi:rRNA maturation endonuclease Nob1
MEDAPAPSLPVLAEALHQLDTEMHQHEVMVRAIASQIGYMLPADYIDADLIQRDVAASLRRSVEGCLEVGRGLTVLKATCEHGNFIARLDVLGIERSVAARFMQAARKFSNVASNASFVKAIGNQTKLFEMLILDDEQIEELALTGQTGELTLDKFATMSVKELRTTLRQKEFEESKKVQDLEETIEASRRRVAEKDEELNTLKNRIEKLTNKAGNWHPRTFEISMENTRVLGLTMQGLDQLDTLRDVILNEDFGDQDRDAAIEMMAVVYYDAIDQLTGRLAEISHACDTVFIGYKEKARPILDVFGPQGKAE